MTEFNRDKIQSFHFVRHDFDPITGVAKLVYAFDTGPEMVETITFPVQPFTEVPKDRAESLYRALQLLHLIVGVSYYKAAVPPNIKIDFGDIDPATANLLETIYEQGLGEFAYRNKLNLRGKIKFPAKAQALNPAPKLGLDEHALVAIGGGKDSLVSIEALKNLNIKQTVSWVGSSQLIEACAQHTGQHTLHIQRTLAPELFTLNHQGAHNGHIPVTAINSAILVSAALLSNANQVVFSNERSASYGSLIPGTGEVNHQWSKSWAFEQAFGEYVENYIAADLHYYSLLRPLSELAVAKQFARTNRYDNYFSSCNRNFHILGERPSNRWCGVCPKCHFVFLALAPFMPKLRLVSIFGRNLLDDLSQADGYDALLEFHDHKPFECVGEGKESRAAFMALAQRPEWKEDALIVRFTREILPTLDTSTLPIEPLLTYSNEHRIPATLWEQLRAYFTI